MGNILAIDQGTSGTTAALIDTRTLEFIDKITLEFRQIHPKPGLMEHDPKDIWESVEKSVSILLKRNKKRNLDAIGIANQRETLCSFDSEGRALANAIVWQDRRTHDDCQKLKENGHEKTVRLKTGLTLDPYFSASKMRWLLNHNKEVISALRKGELHFGTVDTFLLFKLTGGDVFATESSNASRTLLMNLQTCDWDTEMLDLFDLKKNILPSIKNSFGFFGKTKGLGFLADGIPIMGILGDQQAALLGQNGHEKGEVKCTYGTGAFVLLNVGETLPLSHPGLLTTVAWRRDGTPCYALEGSCYMAGAAVAWLKDQMEVTSSLIEELALEVKNLEEMEHLLFLPFLTGMASPYWIPQARGAILGMTRNTSRSHLARACLDGIALSVNDLIDAMREASKMELSSLKVDGGAVVNNLLMSIQATISKTCIIRPQIIETTVFGAALAAQWGMENSSLEKINDLWKEERRFFPGSKDRSYYEKKKSLWLESIRRLYF